MGCVRSEARYGFHFCVVGLCAVLTGLVFSSDAADARHHYRARSHLVHHAVHYRRHARHIEEYAPPSASIVVDGNTGEVLHSANPDAVRHPASLTKIMTLYLLFERLDAGKIRLDTPLKISEHAAEQAPTKLGLKPGQTIAVEDAIKAVVTKSANDIAVAIAENLGGAEDEFAKQMTQKAHALGMSRTTYVNASGLPEDDQVTTARDQALLGRAIEDRFPRYYKYFSTEEFVYHGEAMRNHNHLLGSVGGVDGIKTGYTRASGFNLVTSVHRDGRYIVAVVLGGRSAFQRDAHMRELINGHIKEASLRRTAPMLAEKTEQQGAFGKAPLTARAADPMPTASVNTRAAGDANDPMQPLLVKTITFRTAPVQTAPLAPMPALVSVAGGQPGPAVMPAVRSQPATQAAAQPVAQTAAQPAAQRAARPAAQTAAQPAAQTVRQPAAQAVAQVLDAPRTLVVASAGPAPVASGKGDMIKPEAAAPEPAKVEPARAAAAETEPAKAASKADPKIAAAPSAPAEPAAPQIHVHGGWLIQIGAFEGEDEAKQHLSDAQSKAGAILAAADPFTEPVQKGDKALYRARFAGFDKETAEAACKKLKRNDFACMALKN